MLRLFWATLEKVKAAWLTNKDGEDLKGRFNPYRLGFGGKHGDEKIINIIGCIHNGVCGNT